MKNYLKLSSMDFEINITTILPFSLVASEAFPTVPYRTAQLYHT
jgi:hypothetical protein